MATAAITGTATPSIREADIVTGSKTIIITLTGDTWVTAGATFDAQRQNIINGLDSAQAEAAGWDAQVKANLAVGTVVRTSNTIVTVTLSAQAAYNITARETVTVTIPATAVAGAAQIVATPTINCVQGPATFYVATDGSNTAAGDTWATRRLTIQSAVTSANTAGDTVYVAPGTYREEVTFGFSGTAGNVISLIGDYTGANTSGTKGIVRITGSANDIARTRANCITATGKSYITVRGFRFDLGSSHLINLLTTCANWTISACNFATEGNGRYGVSMASACTNAAISNCLFTGCGGVAASGTATDNSGHTITSCVFQSVFSIGGASSGVNIVGVGGVTVSNCVIMGTTAQGINATSLNGGQTVTVNNCILTGCWYAFYAGSVGMITENYNATWDNSTDRFNVTAGANSVARPPLFDTRWFFEMVNGGRMVTPFDLASYSSIVEYTSGTGAPSTDIRGASAKGTYREWGALEYDSTLSIAGGGASRVIGSPFIRGLGAV